MEYTQSPETFPPFSDDCYPWNQYLSKWNLGNNCSAADHVSGYYFIKQVMFLKYSGCPFINNLIKLIFTCDRWSEFILRYQSGRVDYLETSVASIISFLITRTSIKGIALPDSISIAESKANFSKYFMLMLLTMRDTELPIAMSSFCCKNLSST
jgi:hypothetical protein